MWEVFQDRGVSSFFKRALGTLTSSHTSTPSGRMHHSRLTAYEVVVCHTNDWPPSRVPTPPCKISEVAHTCSCRGLSQSLSGPRKYKDVCSQAGDAPLPHLRAVTPLTQRKTRHSQSHESPKEQLSQDVQASARQAQETVWMNDKTAAVILRLARPTRSWPSKSSP